MLQATLLAFFSFFCFITLAKSNDENCNQISQTFYQTEDKWYDLGCSESAKVQSNQTLAYQCRFLQKKMDIFGRKYYDFRVRSSFPTATISNNKYLKFFVELVGLDRM